ncbi:hypothetical protein [Streptomyces sp. NPDC088115]|uniref:hypothetical protein n=1 Tax=Streptomyces sp. NPDC088115 TaxID=3365824 RepID=UPI0037FEC4B7
MSAPSPEQLAAVRALLTERRARLYAQARFTAAGRRAAWRTIRPTSGRTPMRETKNECQTKSDSYLDHDFWDDGRGYQCRRCGTFLDELEDEG